MISTKGLTYSYSTGQKLVFPDFDYKQGSHGLILGQSGCGKTTLLHLIAGLLRPQTGNITIQQQDITTLSETGLDHFRGNHIGIIFQRPHLIDALTVQQNLVVAQYLAGKTQSVIKAKNILEQLGLGSKLDRYPYQLSLGERQRVTIGRALMNDPTLILADEPTSSLDDKNCEEVLDLLQEQSQKHHATLLVVTHDNRLKSTFDQQIVLEPAQQSF